MDGVLLLGFSRQEPAAPTLNDRPVSGTSAPPTHTPSPVRGAHGGDGHDHLDGFAVSLPPVVSDPEVCFENPAWGDPPHDFSEAVLDSRFDDGTYIRCSYCHGRKP